LGNTAMETHDLMLYQVPNFTTKINLLNLLMRDEEVFDKVLVFVNSKQTAHKLSQSLYAKKGEVQVLNPLFYDEEGITDVNIFKQMPNCRILIVAHEGASAVDITGIPFIFNFEVPENKDLFVQYSIKTTDEDVIAITFATDIELPELRKIEQTIGKKIATMPLPDDLVIFRPSTGPKEKVKVDESRGGSFHKKKESNSKTYNYGGGQKAKMTMKKKKG